METTEKTIVPVRFLHFYGNYRVVLEKLPAIIPSRGMRIHRNLPTVEVWGDGANVRIRGQEDDQDSMSGEAFDVHHFGSVRNPARLRQKWRTQAKQHDTARPRWDRLPGFVFELFPHRWDDPDCLSGLTIYEGPHIGTVRSDPAEFTRDGLWLYEHLKSRSTGP